MDTLRHKDLDRIPVGILTVMDQAGERSGSSRVGPTVASHSSRRSAVAIPSWRA
jgi:hypothetical protein